MRGSTGTATRLRYVLPHQKQLVSLVPLSRKAKQRLKWFDYYQRHSNNATLTCRHFGIPRSLFYKWHKRIETIGIKGLESRSTKPKHCRSREISPDIQARVSLLRKENPSWSKYKLSCILKRDHGIVISPSSVNRIFHDKNLFWQPRSQSQRVARRTWSIRRTRAPRRLRGATPGSLVEIDVKHLPYLGTTNYEFTAIDTCTKMKYIQVFARRSATCGQRFIEAMLDYFPFQVKHINSDNGGEFLSHCHHYLRSKNITHYFSRPRTPKDNPTVECSIKADEYEFWVWGNLASTVKELNQKAAYWTNKFNTYRPHQALNYLTPKEYYERTLSK